MLQRLQSGYVHVLCAIGHKYKGCFLDFCQCNANLWQKGGGTSCLLQLFSFFFFFHLFQVSKKCWKVLNKPCWCITNRAGVDSQWLGCRVVLWCLCGLSFGLDSAWMENSKTMFFISLSLMWAISPFDKCAMIQSEQQNYWVLGYLVSVLSALYFSSFSI